MVYIYTLSDPITNEVRYCGKTSRTLKKRLSGHLREKKVIEKYDWIKNIKNNNLIPIIEIIDEVGDSDWDFWEKYWISQLKTWGFDLLNKTNGGEYSVTGFKHSEESKKKISESQIGKKFNDEWRKNISFGKKGVKFTDKHLKNLSDSHKGLIPINRIPILQIDIKNGEIFG